MQTLCILVSSIFSIFLIILILIQRGKGGGLAGAFGGMGGQSAFGTKAGDVFTRTTIIIVIIWFALAILTIHYLKWESGTGDFGFGDGETVQTLDETGTGTAPVSTVPTSDAPVSTAPAPADNP
ncbi:MAG: preprotein translocase subunit SecG [Planctomycetaceae bacterium]|nr:preprotein translocase subunit SecG [Planctomycetaceae bacterium]